MAAKYEDYLAIQVINEGNIVSYRNLSRELKIHNNAAKEMLYDFYQTQNSRKAGSVHATYLITGARKPEPEPSNGVHHQDGEDSLMDDGALMSSSLPDPADENAPIPIPVTSITVAKEEDLSAVKGIYDKISSIHVYALGPGPVKDLEILSDCNQRVTLEHGTEDPLETLKIYGAIQNPNVKRRTTRKLLPEPASAQGPKTAGAKANSIGSKAEPTTKSSTKTMAKVPTLKKNNSNLFASFAKSKSDSKTGDSQTSEAASPISIAPDSNAEDEPMKDASEDEMDDAFALDASNEAKERAEQSRKAKKSREDRLRQMMEEEDDDPMEDPAAEVEAVDTQEKPVEEVTGSQDVTTPEEPQTNVSSGRRRGKRKVMKKKTTKDAEGYLVTKEEAVWESFSEDEPDPKRAQIPIAASTTAKAKKTGHPGQGNIMSFFGKK